MTDASDDKRDFFVSYTSGDEPWAEWMAWAVEKAGWSVWFQKWDFHGNFVLQMDHSNDLSDRTIGILSARALGSEQVQAEWDARRAVDPRNKRESLILIKVGPCDVPGLLKPFIWLDLTETDQDTAKDKLVAWLRRQRRKPGKAPPFPPSPSREKPTEQPRFPGALPPMAANRVSTYDVFLSHAHLDAEAVESLGARLADEAQLRVWLDRWVLVPGKHWQQEIAKGLDRASACAVCIGSHTPEGWFREEIERALNRQTKDSEFRVIPVILPEGDPKFVDSFLELRTWVDFRKGLKDGYAFHVLVSGIRGVAPGRYPNEKVGGNDKFLLVRENLLRIRALRLEQLIDNDIALEYQRLILNKIIKPEI